MAKKSKYKKIRATLLLEITLPKELWASMSIDDKRRLMDLNRLDIRWRAGPHMVMVFQLGDLFKIRNLLRKYGYTIAYPERTELKKYGLTYSGESLEITARSNDFVITQQFPDGRVETHVVPKDRVFRVYYIIKNYFEKHPDKEKVATPVIWELICRDFGIHRFFDRYGKFHPNSFFGDRTTYFDFAYFPMKVLQHIGKIRYESKWIYNPIKKEVLE